MKPSSSPNAAIGPVVGLTMPILIAALCALAGIMRRIAGAATRPPASLTTSRRDGAPFDSVPFLFVMFVLPGMLVRPGHEPGGAEKLSLGQLRREREIIAHHGIGM